MNSFLAKIRPVLLLASDIILLYLGLFLTLFFRYGQGFNWQIWHNHWPIFSGLFFLWLVIFYAFNLYEEASGRNFFELFSNYWPALILNLLLSVVYFYLLSPSTNLTPKTILAIFMVIFSCLFFLSRKLITQLTGSDKLCQNFIFIGYQPLINGLLLKPTSLQRAGLAPKGIINESPAALDCPLPVYQLSQLEEIIKKEKINLVVINETGNQAVTEALFKILPLKVNFVSLTNFYEQLKQRVPLEIISRGWFLDNLTEGSKDLHEFVKRVVDIVLAALGGAISLFLIPFIVLAIKIDSKGGAIFKQRRLGKDGKIFIALKFRTMYQNAEKTGPSWAKESDPRITRVGRFLRKIRLDEIPQLLNILKGDMSFVGPRPERPEFIAELTQAIPFYRERLLVKPGLTGWAQINFPYADSVESSLKKLQYDLYYIKHRTIILDLSILLKTIRIIFKKLGR